MRTAQYMIAFQRMTRCNPFLYCPIQKYLVGILWFSHLATQA